MAGIIISKINEASNIVNGYDKIQMLPRGLVHL